MGIFLGLILLAIAVSLDSFGVGVTYGMRKIRVPFISLFIIMLCSGLVVFVSMTIGNLVSSFISSGTTKVIGSIILISIGLISLYNVVRTKNNDQSDESKVKSYEPKEKEWKFELQKLGLIITVLKKPQEADLDNSGIISGIEALLLGFALALDAFGAGIGAAMVGYSPITTAMVIALTSGLFVFLGIKSGFILSKIKCMQKMVYIPPFLLISLGLFKLLTGQI